MLSFGVDNKIILEQNFDQILVAKRRKKVRKANKHARAQRRKK